MNVGVMGGVMNECEEESRASVGRRDWNVERRNMRTWGGRVSRRN